MVDETKIAILRKGGHMKRYLSIALVAFLYSATAAGAQQVRFESLSEGIVNALTDKKNSSGSVNLKVEFDVNSANIRKESYTVLQELCKALNHYELIERNVIIKGHTDSDGSAQYNKKLSGKRARSVKTFVQNECGIPDWRMKIIGCGEEFPIAPNTTKAGKQQNRRVEIQLDREKTSPSMEKENTGFQELDSF